MSSEPFAIGVDVGGTHVRAARISQSGEILGKKVLSGSRDSAKALELIRDLIREMDGLGAAAIGIGVPGRVNGWTGEVLSGGYLDLSGQDLKAVIARTFDKLDWHGVQSPAAFSLAFGAARAPHTLCRHTPPHHQAPCSLCA